MGHPPAHHSTANQYLSGSGWEIMYLCCVYVFVVVICACFDCKCKSLNRLGENNKKQKKQKKLREKHKKNINIGYPALEPPRINI